SSPRSSRRRGSRLRRPRAGAPRARRASRAPRLSRVRSWSPRGISRSRNSAGCPVPRSRSMSIQPLLSAKHRSVPRRPPARQPPSGVGRPTHPKLRAVRLSLWSGGQATWNPSAGVGSQELPKLIGRRPGEELRKAVGEDEPGNLGLGVDVGPRGRLGVVEALRDDGDEFERFGDIKDRRGTAPAEMTHGAQGRAVPGDGLERAEPSDALRSNERDCGEGGAVNPATKHTVAVGDRAKRPRHSVPQLPAATPASGFQSSLPPPNGLATSLFGTFSPLSFRRAEAVNLQDLCQAL